MSDIAFSLVIPVIAGVLLGSYLDGIYHSKIPVWTIACSVLGIVTGMWSVYKKYIK